MSDSPVKGQSTCPICNGTWDWNHECVVHGSVVSDAIRYGVLPERILSASGGANATQEGGSHYKEMSVQPWDVIDTWSLDQRIGAYRAGALKYIMRMGSKDQHAQEIKKARHYCEKLVEVLTEALGDARKED